MAEATYQVLRDNFRTGVGEDYVPGVAWVFDGDNIFLFSDMAMSRERAEAQQHLDYARNRGYSDKGIWEELLEKGGNGYHMLRTGPFTVSGGDVDAIGVAQVAHMGKSA